MNKVRNILIAILAVVFAITAAYFFKTLTKKPSAAIDFEFTAQNGTQTTLKDALNGGGVLAFFDPDYDESVTLLKRLLNTKDLSVVAVSVSDKDVEEQLKSLGKTANKADCLVFDSADILKLYNIKNAPVTYFINSEFYITNGYLGDIKQSTINKNIV